MSQPQPPPLDEQGEAHEALNSAVASYGARILENPQVLRNVITDLLPDQSREQNLLIAAAEAGVAADLSQHVRDQNLDSSTAVQLAAHALAGKKSIDADSSMWVTTEYARAMGYTVPAYVPQSVPASAPPSPSNATPPPQSVPPYAQSVPPQSVPPYAQSVPPQPPPPYAQQSVPPSGAWGGGGVPVTPWTSGQTPPGGPMMPPGGGKGKNRGILIAAAAAAAVLVIWMVTAASAHVFPFHPAPAPTPTHPPVVQPSPTPPSPSPSSSPSPSGPSNTDVANQIADLVVGNGALTALSGPDGDATKASCNPDTVSNPPDVNTPTTASCDIVLLGTGQPGGRR